MTRKEEIINAAYNEAEVERQLKMHPQVFEQGFVAGAKWADEHPKQIEISLEDIEELAKEVIPDDWVKRQDTLWEMIRRNQRAQFIYEASEWLEENMNDVGIRFMRGDEIKDIVDLFRKAMKGE